MKKLTREPLCGMDDIKDGPQEIQDFPGGSVVKNSPAIAGNTGSIPGLERSPGERKGNQLQNSCLENLTDRFFTVSATWETHCSLQLSTNGMHQSFSL